MKTAVVCLLVALMGCAALASDRSLQWSFDDGATVTSSLGAKAVSKEEGANAKSKSYVSGYGSSTEGSVKLTGYADSEAYAVAISECKVILKKVFADARGKKFVYAKAKAHASALAKTFAAAFTKTYVKVESNGEGAKGCVNAKALAASCAEAFAGVYVKAVTYIKSYYGYKYLQVQSKSDYAALFSKAFSASASSVCAAGYASSAAYQTTLAKSAASAYIYAFAEACSFSYYGGFIGGSGGRTGGSHYTKEDEYVDTDGAVHTETKDNGYAEGYTGAFGDASAAVLEPCSNYYDYKHCCGYYKPVLGKKLKECKVVYYKYKKAYKTEKGACTC